VLAVVGTALAGCAAPALPPGGARVEGRVEFATGGLPPGSVLEIAVEDTARADAPAIRIAARRILDPRPGMPYWIDYDPRAVPGYARLSVRARITAGERLLHITDRFHPVSRESGVGRVDLQLRAVGRPH